MMEEEEEYEEGDMKVKVMKIGDGDVHEMMNQILGGH